MYSLISKAKLFSAVTLTNEIMIVLIDIDNNKIIDEYREKILGEGVEIINKLIRAAALTENQTEQLHFEYPTYEEISFLFFIFPVMREFFPKEKNLTQFFIHIIKENLTAIKNGRSENSDRLKNFFSGLGKEIRKELAAHKYADDDE